MPTALLPLLLAVVTADPSAAAQAAAERALHPPATRVELHRVRTRLPAGCTVRDAETAPLRSSGRVVVALSGTDARGRRCTGLVAASARVFGRVPVTTAAAAEGSPVGPVTQVREQELRAGLQPLDGPLGALVFVHRVEPGRPVDQADVRLQLPPAGTAVTVATRVAGITVQQPGRLVACGSRRACAQLGNGRQVDGRLLAGTLWVEAP
ncbi:MAG: hypothetical protein HY904_05995 [Deltaproteobacteria bacterium]|nr:hypothetical protein [Deltaproteobacteria bacterium]